MLSAARFNRTLMVAAVAVALSAGWPDSTAVAQPTRPVEPTEADEPRRQADPSAPVAAMAGFGGRWTLQQWAPLRLVFRNVGPVKSVEVFCEDGGPTFRLAGPPAPDAENYVDVAVYPQVASARWTVRLVGTDGRARLFPLELGVRFDGHPGPTDAATDWRSDAAAMRAPAAMYLAAAQSLRIALEDHEGAAFLATGRELTIAGSADGAAESRLSLAETFGPQPAPLVPPAQELMHPFYKTVWTPGLVRWPAADRKAAAALLAVTALAVAAAGLLTARRPRLGAAMIGAICLAAAAAMVGLLTSRPTGMTVQMELWTRPGRPPAVGELPAPVRRERWLAVAANRSGWFEVPPTDPTARVIVNALSAQPAVVLPAAFQTDPPRPAAVYLAPGHVRALDATCYQVQAGRMERVDGRLVWQDWPVALSRAYLVSDAYAVPVGSIGTGNGQLRIDPTERVLWETVFEAGRWDDLADSLSKRLLAHWSRRPQPARGGRHWLVGWVDEGQGGAQRGVLALPALYAIDLGPIALGEQP